MTSIKKHFLHLITLSLLSTHALADSANVMTFNLRVAIDPAPYDWQTRLPRIVSTITDNKPDFLGVQEVTPAMLKDVRDHLPGYKVIGRGRDADSNGEGTQIFYLQDRWEADEKDQGTLQLSPTPEVPGSNGWAMQFPRILTWVHLREQKTGKHIYVFNTHFPLVPEERNLSAQLLAATIANRKHKKDPVILMGDFNACEHEASIGYLTGYGNSPISLQDTYKPLHPGDNTSTFHAFGKTQTCKVDYIYVSKNLKAMSASILKESEHFSSDHFAVTAQVIF